MEYIEAPNNPVAWPMTPKEDSIFIAGSITGAVNWQKEIINLQPIRFAPTIAECFHVFNPRRDAYDGLIPNEEFKQIHWEYNAITHCEKILFWFSSETLAPITLFELGSALNTHKHENIFIGIHPEYKRKKDVAIQTQLRNSELSSRIVHSLEALANQVVRARINS